MSIELVMTSNHFILCLLLPLVFPRIRVFSNESVHLMRWPKYWSFSFRISLVRFSRSVVSDSLQPHGLRHARPHCPSPAPGVYPNSCPLSGDAIHPSHPLSFPSPPAPNPSQHQGLFQWVNSSHEVAKVLEFQL